MSSLDEHKDSSADEPAPQNLVPLMVAEANDLLQQLPEEIPGAVTVLKNIERACMEKQDECKVLIIAILQKLQKTVQLYQAEKPLLDELNDARAVISELLGKIDEATHELETEKTKPERKWRTKMGPQQLPQDEEKIAHLSANLQLWEEELNDIRKTLQEKLQIEQRVMQEVRDVMSILKDTRMSLEHLLQGTVPTENAPRQASSKRPHTVERLGSTEDYDVLSVSAIIGKWHRNYVIPYAEKDGLRAKLCLFLTRLDECHRVEKDLRSQLPKDILANLEKNFHSVATQKPTHSLKENAQRYYRAETSAKIYEQLQSGNRRLQQAIICNPSTPEDFKDKLKEGWEDYHCVLPLKHYSIGVTPNTSPAFLQSIEIGANVEESAMNEIVNSYLQVLQKLAMDIGREEKQTPNEAMQAALSNEEEFVGNPAAVEVNKILELIPKDTHAALRLNILNAFLHSGKDRLKYYKPASRTSAVIAKMNIALCRQIKSTYYQWLEQQHKPGT